MDNNELDFFVHGYHRFTLFGQEFYLSTSHVCLAFVFLSLVVFGIVCNRVIRKADPEKAPGKFLNFIEFLVETIDSFVRSSLGSKSYSKRFANYIGSLFALILCCNLSGLFGLRPPTADWGVTLPLALITFFMIQYTGFRYQKFGKIKGLFEPIFLFFPLNLISEVATPLSMSLRLFGNIVSGTVIMALIYGLLPKIILIAWPAALHLYLDVFAGALQTYVFCVLTMAFISDAKGEEA